MKPLSLTRTFALAALTLGALGLGSAAHARSDVFFSIGVQAPGVYVQPAPVYVQPRPLYVQPAPVYVQPHPVYRHGQPAWDHDRGRRYDHHGWNRRGPYGDRDGDGIANVYDHRDGYRDGWRDGGRDGWRDGGRYGRRYGPHGDLDRDGVPNQDDRDADGDGVRNRLDRFPLDPHRY
jgi:hypothetical protein